MPVINSDENPVPGFQYYHDKYAGMEYIRFDGRVFLPQAGTDSGFFWFAVGYSAAMIGIGFTLGYFIFR